MLPFALGYVVANYQVLAKKVVKEKKKKQVLRRGRLDFSLTAALIVEAKIFF